MTRGGRERNNKLSQRPLVPDKPDQSKRFSHGEGMIQSYPRERSHMNMQTGHPFRVKLAASAGEPVGAAAASQVMSQFRRKTAAGYLKPDPLHSSGLAPFPRFRSPLKHTECQPKKPLIT
jgi:hypothetical protein